MSVAAFTKLFVKSIGYLLGSVKRRPLSKYWMELHYAILIKRLDSLYFSMHSLSHLGCFENSLWKMIFDVLSLE